MAGAPREKRTSMLHENEWTTKSNGQDHDKGLEQHGKKHG